MFTKVIRRVLREKRQAMSPLLYRISRVQSGLQAIQRQLGTLHNARQVPGPSTSKVYHPGGWTTQVVQHGHDFLLELTDTFGVHTQQDLDVIADIKEYLGRVPEFADSMDNQACPPSAVWIGVLPDRVFFLRSALSA